MSAAPESDLLAALAGTRGRQPVAGCRAPALIVVDVQRLFCDPRSPAALPGWSACAPRLRALVRAFAAATRPVVFTRHQHAGADDGGLIGHFFARLLRADDPLAALDPALADLWGAHAVVDKDRHSALEAPGLQRHLAGCDALVLAGVQTPLCVLATALDAARHALVPVIAVDACAARTAEDHLAALRTLAAGHAHVASVDEILASFGWTP